MNIQNYKIIDEDEAQFCGKTCILISIGRVSSYHENKFGTINNILKEKITIRLLACKYSYNTT